MCAEVWEPLIYTFKTDFHEPLTVSPLPEMSYELAQIPFRRNVSHKIIIFIFICN